MRELLALFRRIGACRLPARTARRRRDTARHCPSPSTDWPPSEAASVAEIPPDGLALERERARVLDVSNEQIERRPEAAAPRRSARDR